MSKKSKSASKERRLKEKRSRKLTMAARYEAYAKAGGNSKRQSLKAKRRNGDVSTVSHPVGKCGNVGCAKCNPLKLPPACFMRQNGKCYLPGGSVKVQ
jgi:hypothetical protein